MTAGDHAAAETSSAPDVSVIIVSWNGRRYLEACLRAVEGQHDVRAEIVLVDNGSTDGTVELVRSTFPSVRIVRLEQNQGFAGGNNAGAREARGEFLAFLNNDTVPESNWLSTLRLGIDRDAGFALVTSRIVYMHDPGIIDSAGDGLFRAGAAFKRHHGERVDSAETPIEVFGVCGAACLMPRAVFEELGGFDADFFASHEDVDLSYRARLHGYRCRYVPAALVRHHGSATLGTISSFAVFHGQRNLEWMYLKNTPMSLLVRTLPAHILYNAAAAVHFARRGLLGTFLKAKGAALAGLSRVLEKRTAIQKTRRVGADRIEPHLEREWLATKRREKRFDVGLAEGRR
jgi:GT2 family glycosyltransferase